MAGVRPPWRHAVVTGASSGIGEAIARELAMLGVGLTLVARRSEELERLATQLRRKGAPEVEVLVADLTERRGLAAVEARLADGSRPVDLLVNDAGMGTGGPFAELSIDHEVAEIELNVVAVVRLTHAAVGPMRERGRGAVLNVSSLAGLAPAPNNATYAASKAFVTSFSESLHEDLRNTGVSVTAVLPGFTRTEFHQHVGRDTVRRVPRQVWMSATTVAQSAVTATAAGRAICIPGWGYRLLAGATSLLPRGTRRRIVGWMGRG